MRLTLIASAALVIVGAIVPSVQGVWFEDTQRYIRRGYHRNEAEFGISLHGDATDVHVWRSPPGLPAGADARSMIHAKAARHGGQTVYEAAVDWQLLPRFEPRPERSFGICIVVNDVDSGVRRSAEYGSGIAHAKRPTEFAALRLVNR